MNHHAPCPSGCMCDDARMPKPLVSSACCSLVCSFVRKGLRMNERMWFVGAVMVALRVVEALVKSIPRLSSGETENGLFFPIAVAGDDHQRTRGLAADLSIQAQAACRLRLLPLQQCLMGGMGMACSGIRCDWSPVRSGYAQYSRCSKNRLKQTVRFRNPQPPSAISARFCRNTTGGTAGKRCQFITT
jgi:hypothetical protein